MVLLSFGEIIWDIYSQNEQTLGGAPLNFAAKLSAKISAFVVAHKEAIPQTVKNFIKNLFSNQKEQ